MKTDEGVTTAPKSKDETKAAQGTAQQVWYPCSGCQLNFPGFPHLIEGKNPYCNDCFQKNFSFCSYCRLLFNRLGMRLVPTKKCGSTVSCCKGCYFKYYNKTNCAGCAGLFSPSSPGYLLNFHLYCQSCHRYNLFQIRQREAAIHAASRAAAEREARAVAAQKAHAAALRARDEHLRVYSGMCSYCKNPSNQLVKQQDAIYICPGCCLRQQSC